MLGVIEVLDVLDVVDVLEMVVMLDVVELLDVLLDMTVELVSRLGSAARGPTIGG